MAMRLARAARSPVDQCFQMTNLFQNGMGSIIFSRRMANGDIASGQFLVDIWCLGVKDAFFRIGPAGDYESYIEQNRARFELEPVHPSCAKKIVESAVEYANKLGLKPHPDYKVASLLFGDVDASLCPTEYRFGKDGKPLYMAGPNDTVAKSRRIVKQLRKVCGEGGFHYIIGTDDPDMIF